MTGISWQVVSEPDPGSEVITAWDELAVARGRPYCAPAWMLSWGAIDRGQAHLRIGIARNGNRIAGVVPLIGRPLPLGGGTRYELLSSGIGFRIEPLAAPGEQQAVAAASGELLASLDPPLGVLSLHGIDPDSGWSAAMAAAYPGDNGARVIRRTTLHAPILSIDGASDYESWLQAKSRHFRKRAASDKRKFQRIGELRVASTASELARAMKAFVSLHLDRWRDVGRSGRSGLDHPSMPARLIAAGEQLGPDRIRAATAVVDDEIVSVDIFVHAGSVAASWNGGWLESYRSFRPGWLTLMAGIEDAIDLGISEVDLGPGAHPWKARLSTRDSSVVSDRVIPRSLRSLPTYLSLVPEQLREITRRRPSPAA